MAVRFPVPTLRRLWRGLLRVAFFALLASSLMVLSLRWVNPPTTLLMLGQWRQHGSIAQEWVPMREMADVLPLSAAAAEDANFCLHHGFDFSGIRDALSDDRRLRGASTISQQVAKNVFLWPARSWLRKGLEAVLTVQLELLVPKRRIIEVYLNVAEMATGVFGVEAAAQHYWGVGADDLGPQRAARLMAVLPDPRGRSPVSGSSFIVRRGAQIQKGAETIRVDGRADCFL